jgi:diadenosine tetraphosphate (Ap4A) HIT family hydrolase
VAGGIAQGAAGPDPDRVIGESEHWLIVLNDDQSLLGRTYLMLKRPEKDVLALTAEEQSDMFTLSKRARTAMEALWDPDHFNYAFLMNRTPQVHFHIIPRYRQRREFAGGTFVDPEFGDHYGVGPARKLSPGAYTEILAALRKRLGR